MYCNLSSVKLSKVEKGAPSKDIAALSAPHNLVSSTFLSAM